MKFGIIKSKIEKLFVESYNNNTFKDQLFIFEELVLNNKNIKNIYHLYSELSQNKGFNDYLAENFINESVDIYHNAISKVSKNEWSELNAWLSNVDTKNEYSDIDNLFSVGNVSIMEQKGKSKLIILETLKQTPETTTSVPNVTIGELVETANNTLNNYLKTLSETDKSKVLNVLNESDEKLSLKFEILKENIIDKLTEIKESETDPEILEKISETMTKVTTENFDRITYLKLRDLDRDL